MQHHSKKLIIVITVIALVGLAGYALADWGKGYGSRGQGWGGPGRHHRWDERGYGPGMGALSQEQQTKLDEQRQTFFKGTEELRREIYQKELELKSELAKKDPDASKAADIQKALSALRGDMDQKRLEHQLKVKQIVPYAARGFKGGGRGFGGGPGYGRGYGSGGNCWR